MGKMAAVKKSKRLKMKKLLVALILIRRIRRKEKKRSMWVRPWISLRKEQGAFHNLVRELEEKYKEMYKRYFRMNENTFQFILNKVKPVISKLDTHLRTANHHVLGKQSVIGLSTSNLFLHPAHKRFLFLVAGDKK